MAERRTTRVVFAAARVCLIEVSRWFRAFRGWRAVGGKTSSGDLGPALGSRSGIVPELPEVETMVRGIRTAVERRRIVEVRWCPTSCRPFSLCPPFPEFAERQRGQVVTSVERFGKRVVLNLSDGATVAIEPRMTGLLLLADPPDWEHLRLEWRFAGRGEFSRLWFWDRRGLGTVRYDPPGVLHAVLKSKLGPDALRMTLADWRSRCRATARPIKVALLDQKLVAGIGNLYASEILHAARIHPAQPADTLTTAQLTWLHRAVQSVLKEAIRYEGSTLGDGTYRNALNRAGNYQNVHKVYARFNEPCPTCKNGRIARIVQAQRSTFYCPQCQRRR
jgi:formamidopyrimidine-DNA glycosylase